MAVPWSDGSLRGIARRSSARLTNRPSPTTSWQTAACETFGAPWLDLVVRAGRAVDLAARDGDDDRSLRREAFLGVWRAAEDAQAHHHRVAMLSPASRRANAELLADIHTRIDGLVRAIEASAEEAVRTTSEAALRWTAGARLTELSDRLEALRLGFREVAMLDAEDTFL
jgi:hypothetical protein